MKMDMQQLNELDLKTMGQWPTSAKALVAVVLLAKNLSPVIEAGVQAAGAPKAVLGIIIAALNFAWQQARELYADEHLEADGSKLYRLHGTLFFASTTPFLNQFDPANDPSRVTLDCRHLSFVDYSAIAALKTLRERYAKAGKELQVFHLSERCKKLLKRAGVEHH